MKICLVNGIIKMLLFRVQRRSAAIKGEDGLVNKQIFTIVSGDTYLFKVNNGNTRIMSEICSLFIP